MTAADSTAGPPGSELRDPETLSRIVDWATAAALVLGGLLSGALGAGLYALADRDRIAELVADGTITSDDLTDAELIDVTHALLTWGGIGLAVVTTELGLGAGAVLFGLALVVLALLVSVVYLVGLSALGGYLGVAIAEHESGDQGPEERGPDSEE
jgi:hypothetical protein